MVLLLPACLLVSDLWLHRFGDLMSVNSRQQYRDALLRYNEAASVCTGVRTGTVVSRFCSEYYEKARQ